MDKETERIIKEKAIDHFKMNDTRAKIIELCKQSRRPEEVWKLFYGTRGYTYIANLMSQMESLGLLVKRNRRHKGFNATWYLSKPKALIKAREHITGEKVESES